MAISITAVSASAEVTPQSHLLVTISYSHFRSVAKKLVLDSTSSKVKRPISQRGEAEPSRKTINLRGAEIAIETAVTCNYDGSSCREVLQIEAKKKVKGSSTVVSSMQTLFDPFAAGREVAKSSLTIGDERYQIEVFPTRFDLSATSESELN